MDHGTTYTKTATQTCQSALALNMIRMIPRSGVMIHMTRLFSRTSLMFRAIFINLQGVKTMTTLRAFPTRLFGGHLVVRAIQHFMV